MKNVKEFLQNPSHGRAIIGIVAIIFGIALGWGAKEYQIAARDFASPAERKVDGVTIRGRYTTVPIEPFGGVWTVPVKVNKILAVKFMLDTGASITMISHEMADAFGIDTDKAAREQLTTPIGNFVGSRTTLDALQIGEVEIRNVPVLVLHLPLPYGGVGGILGENVLTYFEMTKNTVDQTLRLRHP